MIKNLKIENCESHLDTFFEFSPGLNVFVGESDKGKSGVFRAYKWLVQNSPNGEWMRPLYWEGITKVTGEFVNPDLTVSRLRSKTDNVYILNDDNPINAGTSVPENIATLLNLDDVNLQTQIERAFLMFETAGERGRILNRIAGLDEIETTLDNAKRDVSRLNNLWETEKQTLKAKEKELEEFVDIEEMESRVAAIDEAQQLLTTAESRVLKLSKIKVSLVTLETAITSKEGLLACEDMLTAVNLNVQAVSALQKRVSKLKEMTLDLKEVEADLNKEKFEGIEERFQKIRIAQTQYTNTYQRIKKLKKIVSDADIIDKEIEVAEVELVDLQAKIPNVCFECGAEL